MRHDQWQGIQVIAIDAHDERAQQQRQECPRPGEGVSDFTIINSP
jgi:hypothetical protein